MSEAHAQLPPDRRGDDDSGVSVGQYVSLPAPDNDEDQPEIAPDGSLIVTIGQPYENAHEEGGFYENLADEVVPENILEKLAVDLLRKI